MKRALLLLVVGILLATSLCGCSGVDKRIYGYWADPDGEYMYGFGMDGVGYTTFFGMNIPLVFTMKDDLIYILLKEEGNPLEDEDTMICRLTFFGDDQFALEYPVDSGSYVTYSRQSSSSIEY